MTHIDIRDLAKALRNSWPVDAPGREWKDWPPDNPARGQCEPSALVVQDYFGGDIVRYRVTGDGINETHYFNVLDGGTVIDTTASQYRSPVSMKPEPIDLAKNNFASVRERCLADEETHQRYELLKTRVEKYLHVNH